MTGLIIFIILALILWWALQSQVDSAGAMHHHDDDLVKIEGVGPKIARLLNAAGIHSYDDLAKAKAKDLEKILEEGGSSFNMAEPESWPKQAKLAAKGDWEALQKLQDELIGGK
jgi:predicted flap endonuclease-1-like 5' DNA nuclease